MIVFDLDGTLADCEHRRHFVDPLKNKGVIQWCDTSTGKTHYGTGYIDGVFNRWKPDWKEFYENCDMDTPIQATIEVLWALQKSYYTQDIQVWSARCESVRQKTLKWFDQYIDPANYWNWEKRLKMRPIGDSTPDDVLKERWLDETIAQGKNIYFVFDDRKKVREMWQRRGFFVFDVSQGKGDF